jgi:HK97 family phage portal protein
VGILNRVKTFASNVGILSNISLRGSLKDTEWFKDNFPGWFESIDASGTFSKRKAMRISSVYTCLNILGETFGSLPFDVKQDTKNGRVTRKDHPVYKLIHDRPNSYTNAFDFWSTTVKLIKAWGNSYAKIERQGADPIALWLIHPADVEIIKNKDGLYYRIISTGEVLPHTEILHFKNFSLDGITGLSAIDENRVTMGLAKKLKDYNSSLVGNRPYGYLTAPTAPKDAQTKENMKSQWTGVNKTGVEMVGDVPLLYGGLKFEALTLPADAVAYIESADLSEQEIYGIFRIPPTLGQNYKRATFSNAEQQDLVFSKYSLATRTGIEQECNAKLFRSDNYDSNEPFYTKFNLKGILAGDIQTRKEFYQSMITLGVFSQNNVLDLEDMERFEGGDRRYIQGAMVPLDKIDEFVKKGKTDTNPPQQKEKKSITDDQKLSLKSILNGKYQDVINILEP